MGSPRHLWTGPWREHSERAREAAAEAAELRQPERPAAAGAAAGGAPLDGGAADDAPRARRAEPPSRLTLLLGIALVAAAIAGGAFAAGMIVDHSRGSGGATPLPAVASQPIKPHKGESQAGAIYAAASPAVVSIRTDVGEGTGFLIDNRGTLVTNDHVVGNASHVLVRFGQDGDSIDGDVLGADPSSDLAVVSIDPAQIPRGARPLRFADSRAVQVGELAVAIGNPFGLDRTATQGIVSGLGRSIQSPNGFAIDDVIQTDAPINPGNSGGPLLDDAAHVIGVNSQIATAGVAGNIGIGFAIPSNTVRQVVPQLEQGKAVVHPWLGVVTMPASPTHPDGAQVASVVGGGPAAKGGVHTGDVIKRIDSTTVQSPEDVAKAIGSDKPGQSVAILVERSGRQLTLHATLAKRPTHIP